MFYLKSGINFLVHYCSTEWKNIQLIINNYCPIVADTNDLGVCSIQHSRLTFKRVFTLSLDFITKKVTYKQFSMWHFWNSFLITI